MKSGGLTFLIFNCVFIKTVIEYIGQNLSMSNLQVTNHMQSYLWNNTIAYGILKLLRDKKNKTNFTVIYNKDHHV